MNYRQLLATDVITSEQARQIGHLLHNTDPFIFPCICKEESADLLGSLCQTGEDTVFALKNLFVGEESGKIFALLLWTKGPVRWDSKPLKKLSEKENKNLSPLLNMVQMDYFSEYQNVPPSVISIMNVCVEEGYRNRGIGTEMMNAFLDQHPNETIELFVLSDNSAALSVYSKLGFVIAEDNLTAFTPDKNPAIQSKKMVRN